MPPLRHFSFPFPPSIHPRLNGASLQRNTPNTMCTAKSRLAKCGHTVAYEIMKPCSEYTGGGKPCPAWDENRLNKVLLRDEPVCKKCHVDMERALCRRYLEAERNLVRGKGGAGRGREVWEERLRLGGKMRVEVEKLDGRVGRKGDWREEVR